jgi:hypothetical protein
MGPALLVYALAEHRSRPAFQEQGKAIPNQVGKPAQHPAMRRIFRRLDEMDGLQIPTPGGSATVLHLKPAYCQILRLLGPLVEKNIGTPISCGM